MYRGLLLLSEYTGETKSSTNFLGLFVLQSGSKTKWTLYYSDLPIQVGK